MDFQIKYKRNVGRENVQKNWYYIKTDKYLNDFFGGLHSSTDC